MKKEEYLSRIDEVIARGPYTDTWDSLFTVFRLSETNGIPEICM